MVWVFAAAVSGRHIGTGRARTVGPLADLSVAAAGLGIAWRLLDVRRSRAEGRGFVRLSALTGLGAAAQFATLIDPPTPGEPDPTVWKIVAGALWLIACARLLNTKVEVERTEWPAAEPWTLPPLTPAPVPPDLSAIAERLERLGLLQARARAIEFVVNNESRAIGKAEALRDIREILAELETDQCKT